MSHVCILAILKIIVTQFIFFTFRSHLYWFFPSHIINILQQWCSAELNICRIVVAYLKNKFHTYLRAYVVLPQLKMTLYRKGSYTCSFSLICLQREVVSEVVALIGTNECLQYTWKRLCVEKNLSGENDSYLSYLIQAFFFLSVFTAFYKPFQNISVSV